MVDKRLRDEWNCRYEEWKSWFSEKKSLEEKFVDYILSVDPPDDYAQEIWEELFGNILPEKSPHWPGFGRYIGTVEIGKPNSDRKTWQSRRVYQDELDYFNGQEECSTYERLYK